VSRPTARFAKELPATSQGEGASVMNTRDFSFIVQQQKSTVVESGGGVTRNGRNKRRPTLPVAGTTRLMANDRNRLVRIVEQTSRITSHRELFELLRSDEIQKIIPHQILIAAWGDSGDTNLKLDAISSIPGMRTSLIARCGIGSLLNDLRQRWLNHQQQVLLLNNSAINVRLKCSSCADDCALHRFLRGAWSLMAHGIMNVRDDNFSLYLAFDAVSIVNNPNIERFRSLVGPVITQIDVAFRRIAALKPLSFPAEQEPPASSDRLSRREEEILLLVSEGKSNDEISQILAISVFTVKNHLRRVMQKLDASNRTKAVVNYLQMSLLPERKAPDEK
jgi:transcriptional regulator EpsA